MRPAATKVPISKGNNWSCSLKPLMVWGIIFPLTWTINIKRLENCMHRQQTKSRRTNTNSIEMNPFSISKIIKMLDSVLGISCWCFLHERYSWPLTQKVSIRPRNEPLEAPRQLTHLMIAVALCLLCWWIRVFRSLFTIQATASANMRSSVTVKRANAVHAITITMVTASARTNCPCL